MVKRYIVNATTPVPPTQPLRGREAEMVKNEAGGYVFPADGWQRLLRFLILGTEEHAYYASSADLTKQNINNLKACLVEDPARTIATIVDVWRDGRAPRQQPVMFALAAATGVGLREIPHPDKALAIRSRQLAYAAVPQVCKTLAHYAMFLDFALFFGGSRKGLRRVVREYLENTDVDTLAYQMAKYGTRSGWSVRDLIVWSHPASKGDERRALLFAWALGDEKAPSLSELTHAGFNQIVTMEALKSSYEDVSVSDCAKAIEAWTLTREMVPTQLLKEKVVWNSLSKHMPTMALTRSLNRMGGVGLITANSVPDHVMKVLQDHDRLKRGRIHPLDMFIRMLRYASGHDEYNSWEINQDVLEALNEAMYALMNAQEATGKRIMVALDDSGSMWGYKSPCEAEMACGIGMLFARSEPKAKIVRFSGKAVPFPINPNARYDEVRDLLRSTRVGSMTNGAAPIEYATANNIPVDCFVCATDGQFWAGRNHINTALEEHRRKTGGEGRYASFDLGAYSTRVTDPKDARQMSFVGFDPAAFNVLDQFIKGEL